ncbi:uncharacterized protein LOC121046324 [Ixodes scapularis]|uniref:uncharacterized protein LOC121046324 n=1 Tax=Ixodes scapularis TaxID=6945 RepID=UPI001AD6BCE2|nr:uncharacterized protein LOC121046324 [Ixodes scapularis]
MRKAAQNDAIVRGVKGPCPLINLQGFDIVWSFSPDYMHCVLLGVSRQLTEIWLSCPGEPYYIGDPKKLALIDSKLCCIRPPQCFNRLPRSLMFRKLWKAAEWQKWLLYYSLPCLRDVLPAAFLEHWTLLATRIFHLLKDEVTPEDIAIATQTLVQFVVQMQFLYTKVAMTYNIHLLLHLPKCVVQFGPLWAHSCFSFESNIGKLLKLVTSSNGVPIQIASRVLLKSKLDMCKTNGDINDLLSTKKQPRHVGTRPLGKPKRVEVSLRLFFENSTGCEGSQICEYERMVVNDEVFHSKKYKRPTKTSCAAVRLGDGTYSVIDRIISLLVATAVRCSSSYARMSIRCCLH